MTHCDVMGWCRTCRRRQPIEDEFDEGHMTARGEVAYMVTVFACGHATAGTEQVVAAAPGEPYAPDTVRNLRGLAAYRTRMTDDQKGLDE